jgi:amidohydrolase
MVSKQRVHELTAALGGRLLDMRRHLHMHPELSFEETETARFIMAQLDAIGAPYRSGVGGHGIVAEIKGARSSDRIIGLRGDMDALPIEEANDVVYKSTKSGVMHACGHDAHTTCAFGAVSVLHALRDELPVTYRVLFQPAEERIPGGASLMIRDGALNPLPAAMFGQHVYPELEAGKVGFKPGMYMASADELYFRVKGKGGHGALPRRFSDPVTAAAQLIINLQQIVSRKAPPDLPSVLSIGKIVANGATNIIPNEVYMEGTFRTFNEPWREEAHGWIERITKLTAETFGVEAEVEVRVGYPFLVNDEALTARAIADAEEFLGAENVVPLELRPTAEDFAYFSQQVPSCFFRLGTASPDGRHTSGLHTPTFDIDESALQVGTGMMAWLALQEGFRAGT